MKLLSARATAHHSAHNDSAILLFSQNDDGQNNRWLHEYAPIHFGRGNQVKRMIMVQTPLRFRFGTSRGFDVRLSLLLVACSVAPLYADDILLLVDEVPQHGVVVCDIDLTDAARYCEVTPVVPWRVKAELSPGGTPVPVQFVPTTGFDPEEQVAGTVILKLPAGGKYRVRLKFDSNGPDTPPASRAEPFDRKVTTPFFRAFHDPAKMGGLPSRFEFVTSGKVFQRFRWNDRVHDPTLGSFGLANDRQPKVDRVSSGPLATVVRVRARYMHADGSQRESRPEATYDWCYLHDLPLIRVTATATQQPPRPWREAHFLELNFPGDDFTHWAGGKPPAEGTFEGTTKSFHFNDWGALIDGSDAIAMLDCGRALFYDHRGGSYLHAHGDRAWQPWSEPRREWSAWLWIGTAHKVTEQIRVATDALPTRASVDVAVASIQTQIQAARRRWETQPTTVRQQTWWHAAGAAQLAARGQFKQAIQTAQGHKPPNWTVLQAGDLGLVFVKHDQGISLQSLFDTAAGRQLISTDSEPLFEITMRDVETKQEVRLTADDGWQHVDVSAAAWRDKHSTTGTPARLSRDGQECPSYKKHGSIDRLPQTNSADAPAPKIDLCWNTPTDERIGAVEVVARATPDTDNHCVAWQLKVTSQGDRWALWRVGFPRVAVGELGPDTTLFVPRAAGQVETGAWRRGFTFGGRYPSGWTSMQYMAAYAEDRSTGLYVATHDPFGSTKQIDAHSHPDRRAVTLSFDHPVPDMGKPANQFELSGEAVWQLLRGDWFDAAVIYRDWVREHAKWYPELSADGRADTPQWMRELPVWGLGGGNPKSGLPVLQEFAREMELPVGFHWYNWHQIPFDNDYPHYFPADEGFADAVKLLQQQDIYVMPYINGRLWDTHDRGAEDFKFSKLALPAATKDEDGKPYIETYGSKESDGNKVELAAMCPSTHLWQTKVRDTVLRLVNECHVRGVYIDQVAAAKPQLCFDSAHDHPLGGGHWWTESYWKMLSQIRRDMPHDRILTTECNAEPYLKWFDGYLTWHWQYDGQVPAFPAVYGGAIQMFGRAYRGGPTKDLALRMKAGQQLVFGEQIGWIHPGVVRESENIAFLKEIVQLRWRLRRYFYAGQMTRPPKLQGHIPTVTADWQWSGVWPVTTPAAMTGAWQLPKDNRAVVLMVNVSDDLIATCVEFDARECGIATDKIRVTVVAGGLAQESFTAPRHCNRDVSLPPRTAQAWEIEPAATDEAKD